LRKETHIVKAYKTHGARKGTGSLEGEKKKEEKTA
jgi:hypothetical protein